MNKLTVSLILLLSGLAFTGFGQKAVIKVIDSRSHEPISFAHVQLENLNTKTRQTVTTNIDGEVDNPVQTKSVVSITYVGFRNYYDTIFPGQSLTAQMQPTVYNMDEVVVTGQFTPEAVDKSIFKVKVIGARQIEQKASNNLGELMSGELSIRTSMDAALGSKITMQGLGGEHVKFLIDGVPVIGRMNGDIDLGQLNLYNVKQIEVIEGPMSVIYGSNALAGVINIITGENEYADFQSNASSYIESVGVYNFNADVLLKKGKWQGSLASARNFFDGYGQLDGQRSMAWKPKRQYNLDGAVNYRTQDFKIRFTGSYFNEMLKQKGDLLGPYFETTFDSDFVTNRLTFNANANAKFAKNRHLNVLASFSSYDRTKNTYLIDLTTLDKNLTANVSDHDTTRFNQILLRSEFSKSTNNSKFNYQLGIDFNHETGVGKRIIDQRQQMGDYASFLSVKIQPTVRLMLQPGLRYAYHTRYKSPLVYSLNAKLDLTEELSLRAGYGKGFRTPSLKELYLEFVDVNHNIIGNENLVAENSNNVNLTLGYHKEKPRYDYGVDLDLFYNNIDNSIELAIINYEPLIYTYINLIQKVTQGFKLSFNNRLYPWLEIRTGVGLIGRKEVLDLSSGYNNMSYSNDYQASVNYLWRKADLRFDVFYKYNGDYAEITENGEGEVFRSIQEGYHTMDLNASRSFFGQRLKAQIGVKNLFDITNITVKGDSQGGIHQGGGNSTPVAWGRTFFIRLSYQFQKLSKSNEN